MSAKLATTKLAILVLVSVHFSCQDHTISPRSVSFEGTYITTNEVLNPAPTLKQRTTGTSQAKPLDINKFVATATIHITPPPPFNVSGEATFYADNGDVFTTTFTGTSTPNADGTSAVTVTHTIEGGTGKFEKASGTFVGNALANPKNPTGSITYKGMITY
ncbi:hypothetical protein [Spirosoma sp. KNUC1025]|uniref:hypothetical protein n=1 Tax=Spirosoma sp. KNUC1025 TaxID=2894082 RepID=UPI0038649A22|nr:hypothetical protein LN737_07245 [Spirosoma sp. KNUC1025]